MEQLLAHLIGDYVLQTEWMAENKVKKFWIAVVHAFVYTLPFLFLTTSIMALSVIFFSHAIIDHFRIARYVIFAKNKITNNQMQWDDCSSTGFHKDKPIWLTVWLLIIVDNTIHLTVNYIAIRWL